ncbi:MAG: hypothetical protein P8L68_00425 [Paracoccaceae bacterium]|nr:hypothetical protein [Paracoccaceae bacterium]MDG1738095.1 hypothetical protein [Paracoccaceae bacterium]MDG2256948.1 hypothetical protein [Paracoccaceae bacterium]
MSRERWNIDIDGDKLILSRNPVARFDFCVEATLPDASRLRVAHQVRQDMWRRLQTLRGFSPVVEVERCDSGLLVRAGGQIEAKRFPQRWAERQVQTMMECPITRQRWIRFAAHRKAVA